MSNEQERQTNTYTVISNISQKFIDT